MPATYVEVGGGYVERVSIVVVQKVIQDIGHVMLLVIDDEIDLYMLLFFRFRQHQPLTYKLIMGFEESLTSFIDKAIERSHNDND